MTIHVHWCARVTSHQAEQGCEANVGMVDAEQLEVSVGIFHGVPVVAITVRNPAVPAVLSRDEADRVRELFAEAVRLLDVARALATPCLTCGAPRGTPHVVDCKRSIGPSQSAVPRSARVGG